jgi:hypothetical protein
MVAQNVLLKLPWKKILQEAAKMAPYVYDKIKEVIEERRRNKAYNNEQKVVSVEEKLKLMEGGLKSVENNIVSQADVINRMQDEIGLIMSGLNSFHFRQNIIIGLSIGAVIISVISLVAVLIK